MDIRKMGKTVAVVLLCFSGGALAGLNIYQHHQIEKANRKMSSTTSSGIEPESGLAQTIRSAGIENSQQNQNVSGMSIQTESTETDDLIYQLNAAEEELSMINDQLADEAAREAEKKRLQKELQKKYRENPAFIKSMKENVETEYADLFKKLTLSPAELEQFKELLFEENMAQQDIFTDLGDTDGWTEEQQEELNARIQALDEEYGPKKEELLGASNYATYQKYSETQGERYNVDSFMESMGSDETLTEDQKESLIEAMNAEVQNIEWEKIGDDDDSYSNKYSEENRALMLRNSTRRFDAYLKAANSILSDSQLEKFETYFEKSIEQYETILEMQALRYGAAD